MKELIGIDAGLTLVKNRGLYEECKTTAES